MVDTLLGYPDENQSPELRRRLYVLFKSLEGVTHTSSKNLLKWVQSRPYLISHVDVNKKALVIRKNDHENTYLHYWRFLHVVDILNHSNGKKIRLEPSKHPKHDDTIEGSLFKRARDAPYPYGKMPSASYVCDILNLGGFCEFVSMINPYSEQTVIGVQKLQGVLPRNS